MRKLVKTKQFRSDFKREHKSPHSHDLDARLNYVLMLLMQDLPLPAKYNLHRLKGNYVGYLECHVKPDLLLIFKYPENNTIELTRLGSHSTLF